VLLTVALLAVSAALIFVTPRLLRVRPWAVRHPRLSLFLWFALFCAGCLSAVGSVVSAVVGGLEVGHATDAVTAVVLTVTAWLGLGAVGCTLALLINSGEPIMDAARVQRRDVVPHGSHLDERPSLTLARIPSDDVVACSLPGREPTIIIPTRLESELTPAQLQAVIAHEFAHLEGRHHLLKRIAAVNAACLPRRLRVGREFLRAVTLLLELAADDAAARQAGAVHLANALARIGELVGDPTMVMRAERLTTRSWPTARRCEVPSAIRIRTL